MRRRGRSTILDMGATAPMRERNWALRRLLVILAIATAVLTAIAVTQELLPKDGLALLLYQIHDGLWVPFKAQAWVQNGVGSLTWFVPIGVLAALALTEYLGIAQPVRRLQAAALRLALHSGNGRWVLVLQQYLGWGRDLEAFLIGLIDSDLTRARVDVMEALESGRTIDANALGRATIQRAYLRAGDKAIHAICAETLCLMVALGASRAELEPWERIIARILGPHALKDLRTALQPDPVEIETALDTLADPATSAQRLALMTLAHAGSQVRVAPERVRAWFDLWAQLARMPNAASSHLADAEAMIDFEFWAARAESALIAADHFGDRGGWLAELLPDVRMSRPLGECEAAGYEADARAVVP